MIKHRFCLLALSLLAACATTQTPVESAHPVQASEAYSAPFNGSGLLVVTRDKGIMGMGCSIRILMDGYEAGQLNTGEKLSLYLPSGQHAVSAIPGSGCGGESAETTVSIEAASTHVYRVGSGKEGGIMIGPAVIASGSMR